MTHAMTATEDSAPKFDLRQGLVDIGAILPPDFDLGQLPATYKDDSLCFDTSEGQSVRIMRTSYEDERNFVLVSFEHKRGQGCPIQFLYDDQQKALAIRNKDILFCKDGETLLAQVKAKMRRRNSATEKLIAKLVQHWQ